MKKCPKKHKMKLRLKGENGDNGWFCDECFAYYGLDKDELRIWEMASKITRDNFKYELKQYYQLKKILKDMVD